MRRILIGAAVVVAVVVVVLLLAGGGNDRYLVRAVFDNGSFVVQGEDVRVAGANVGRVESTTVSLPGEVDSYEGGKPRAVPGKAVIVLEITDPGFQDFRRDASCLIRPQSLIGERYIDCRPTLPRAPGSKPPPPLAKIPDGQRGAGQYLLPLENNGKTVDIDLINNILRLPYAQRFRILLNELGAGFATRGKDLAEIIRRADPALRETDRLLAKLAHQRKELAKLAGDSEEIMRPLARERSSVAGFFDKAGISAQATAERSPQLEEALEKFPVFLRQFRQTMRSFEGFSEQALPVTQSLGKAAPSLTVATRRLAPFAAASTVALRSLGEAGEASGSDFRKADKVVRKTLTLARANARPLTNFARFLVTTRQTRGFENLMDLIYNTTGTVNGFDKYGHFMRAAVIPQNCFDYIPHPSTFAFGPSNSGCANGNWVASGNTPGISARAARAMLREMARERRLRARSGAATAPDSLAPGESDGTPRLTPPGPAPQLRSAQPASPGAAAKPRQAAPAAPRVAAQRDLLDYLLGP